MNKEVQHIPVSGDIENDIVIFCLNSPSFFTAIKNDIIPESFYELNYRTLILLNSYIQTYESFPVKETFIDFIEAKKAQAVTDKERLQLDTIKETAAKYYDTDIQENEESYLRRVDYYTEIIRKHRATTNLFSVFTDFVQNKSEDPTYDLNDILPEVYKALSPVSAIQEEETIYLLNTKEGEAGKGVEDLTKTAEFVLGDTNRGEAMGVHLPSMDTCMDGGLRRGELAVLGGGYGTGKTILLQNFGLRAAVYGGYNVLHVNCEMPNARLTERYYRQLLGKSRPELRTDVSILSAELQGYFDQINERYTPGEVVLWRPSRNNNLIGVRTMLDYLHKVRSMKIDLIIIDYIDLMANIKANSALWEEINKLYLDMKQLMLEYSVAIWTASQFNAEALKMLQKGGEKTVITGASSSGSTWKAHHVDYWWSILQTVNEKHNGRLRLFLDKGRNERSKVIVPLAINYDLMTTTDMGEIKTLFDEVSEEKNIQE